LLTSKDVQKIEQLKFSEVDFSKLDLYLALDSPSMEHISHHPIPQNPLPVKTINIDHHTKDKLDYGDINLVTDHSSTSALLFELFKSWKVKIDSKLATLLFTGLSSDTLGFKVPITNSKAFQIAAELIDLGADFLKVNFTLSSHPNNKLKTIGLALSRLESSANQKVITSYLTYQDMENCGLPQTQFRTIHRTILYYLSSSSQAAIAILILQTERGWYISLRSNNPYDVRDVTLIATSFGGGGHKQAGGFSFSGTLEEAKKNVLDKISEVYPDLGRP
jgi:phosphoesterase RecJ-like protein